ncbi:MAG: hypothetical protein AB1508_12695 [Pseudomonadota bacterium]
MTKHSVEEFTAAVAALAKLRSENENAFAPIIDLLNDIVDRVEALEDQNAQRHPGPPSGYIVLKAVGTYGFHPEKIRRLAARGKIGSQRAGSRWFIHEGELKVLAKKAGFS